MKLKIVSNNNESILYFDEDSLQENFKHEYFQIVQNYNLNHTESAIERISKNAIPYQEGDRYELFETQLGANGNDFSRIMAAVNLLFFKFVGHEKYNYSLLLSDTEGYKEYFPCNINMNQNQTFGEVLRNFESLTIVKAKEDQKSPEIGLLFLKGNDFGEGKLSIEKLEGFEILFLFLIGDTIKFLIIYNGNYTKDTILNLGKQLQQVMKDLKTKDNDSTEIELIQPAVNQIEPVHLKEEETLIQLFEKSVVECGDKIAYQDKYQAISFSDLMINVNKLCNYICRMLLKLNQIKVGIYCERSIPSVIAILSTIKVGGIYIPIDKDMPIHKVEEMVHNYKINILICSNDSVAKDIDSIKIIDKNLILQMQEEKDTFESRNLSIYDEMCMMHTSGTTGKPRAVVHTQLTVLNIIRYFSDKCCFDKEDIIGQRSPFQHIPSTEEIFMGLLHQLTTVIIPDEVIIHSADFMNYVNHHKITWVQMVPTLIQTCMLKKAETSIKYLSTLGEELSVATHQRLIHIYPNMVIFNNYGLTEANTILISELNKDYGNRLKMPLGKPIYNTYAVILNDNYEIVPKGIIGQIAAAGYEFPHKLLNCDTSDRIFYHEGLKSEVFLTGDYGNYIENTDLIEYNGRKDALCKINGKRVDLFLLKENVSLYKDLKECEVLQYKEKDRSKIIAFVVFNGEKDQTLLLRKFLSQTMEKFMIPEEIIVLKQLPKTKTGKINRSSLLSYYKSLPKEVENPTDNTVVTKITKILSRLLHIETGIGEDELFNELGMSSFQLVSFLEQVNKEVGTDIKVPDLYNYPTIQKLGEYILSQYDVTENQSQTLRSSESNDIAIIGLSGVFPGDLEIFSFWEELKKGKDFIAPLSEKRKQLLNISSKENVIPGGYLEKIDEFDPLFFKISTREAEYMEPQQRYCLMYIWKLLEDAGYDYEQLKGKKVSVFIGAVENHYLNPSIQKYDEYTKMGTDNTMMAAKISYYFDFRGASIVINTACSSSLTAVYYAYKSILNGEADYAIAGGINIIASKRFFEETSSLGMFTKKADCTPFDEAADGIVPGEAAGFVLLKNLNYAIADNDNIYAVIKGMTINQDGKSNGITAPNGIAQEQLALENFKQANISPTQVTYIETHGTGTKLGDPIEFDSLSKVYGDSEKINYCALGSIKANIGHAVAASGICSFLKSVLSLYTNTLAPQIKFNNPNPLLSLIDSPFYINTQVEQLDAKKEAIISVNSFGYSGVNVNALLQGYKPKVESVAEQKSTYYFIPFSAASLQSLHQYLSVFYDFLKKNKEIRLSQIGYTMQKGRHHFKDYRKAFVATDGSDLMMQIKEFFDDKNAVDVRKEKVSVQQDQGTYEAFINLAKRYEIGEKIDWDQFYPEKERKISLPTYRFQTKKIWIHREEKIESNPTFDCSSWKEELSVLEHKISGNNVVPGAKIISFVKDTYEKTYMKKCNGIGKLQFLKPLIILSDTKIWLELKKDEFVIMNQKNEIYAKGKFRDVPDSVPKSAYELDRMELDFLEDFTMQELYQYYEKNQIDYGNAFRLYQKGKRISGEDCKYSLAIIKADHTKEETFLLDAALHSTKAILNQLQGEAEIPFYIDAILQYKEFSDNQYIVIGYETKNGVDIGIFNTKKEFICQLKGILFRKQKTARLEFYQNQWVSREKMKHTDSLEKEIVFDYSITNQDDRFTSGITVLQKFRSVEAFEVPPGRKEVKILYILPGFEEYEGYFDAFLHLFKLIRKLMEAKVFQVSLLVCFQSEKDFAYIMNASLVSLLGVMHNEMPNYCFRMLEWSSSLNREELCKIINAEMQNNLTNANDYIMYDAKGKRYQLELSKIKRKQTENRIKNKGTYLIVGGCGAIGRIIAKHFVSKYDANLILVGRSPQDKKINEFVESLTTEENTIQYVQADLANRDECAKNLQPLVDHVNGVIQCAGVIKDRLLIKKEYADMNKVLEAKIITTVNVFQLFKDRNLDFLLLFSSLSADICQIGQCDYAYANRFVANFSRFVKAKFPVSAINWSFWENGGMEMDEYSYKQLVNQGYHTINDVAGCEILEQIIQSDIRDVTVY